ncbi:hypothetical protein N8804_01115 [Methylophilaceae bacterium]|nr:hypothetical protein [Methylophilaceae bacterium]
MNKKPFQLPDYDLAPVLIATHTRIDHLAQTIEALKKNLWAEGTDLFISSDAASCDDEKQKVKEIRRYIKRISGFKSLNLIIRDENFGHFDNFQKATDLVFTRYEKIIKLEDDIVTGCYFLKFMNDALNLYVDDKNVVSISGYLWRDIAFDGISDSVLLPIHSGWGWGTWRDRFYSVDHSSHLAKEFMNSSYLFWKMVRINPSLLGNVYSSSNETLKAGDINWALHILKYEKCVLFPTKSLARNIGFDGTGQNCGYIPEMLDQTINDSAIHLQKLNSNYFNSNNKIIYNYFGGNNHLIKQLILYVIQRFFGKNFLKTLLKIKNYFI